MKKLKTVSSCYGNVDFDLMVNDAIYEITSRVGEIVDVQFNSVSFSGDMDNEDYSVRTAFIIYEETYPDNQKENNDATEERKFKESS
jgi:hypothetical protein